jgi:hypothetical protein
MEFIKNLKDWPQDPPSWYKNLIEHDVSLSALSVLCPFTIIRVPSANFINPISQRNIRTLVINQKYNETDKCLYLDWLFDNLDDSEYCFVYLNKKTNMVSDPSKVWAFELYGIMFQTDTTAALFKLHCSEMLV